MKEETLPISYVVDIKCHVIKLNSTGNNSSVTFKYVHYTDYFSLFISYFIPWLFFVNLCSINNFVTVFVPPWMGPWAKPVEKHWTIRHTWLDVIKQVKFTYLIDKCVCVCVCVCVCISVLRGLMKSQENTARPVITFSWRAYIQYPYTILCQFI